MKHNRLRRVEVNSLFIIFVIISLIGCSSSGGGSDHDANATYDASGEWIFNMNPVAGSLETNADCELDDPSVETVILEQNGNKFTVTNEDKNEFAGTVDGDEYTFSGSFEEDDNGDTVTITVSGSFTMTSDNSLTGSMTTRGESGSFYCQWNTNFSATKNGTNPPEEGEIDSNLYGWWLEYDSSFSFFDEDGIAGLTNGKVYDLLCFGTGVDCDWEIDWKDLEYELISAADGSITYVDYELGGTHNGTYSINGDRLILTSDIGVSRYFKRYSGGNHYDLAESDDDGDGYTENQGDCNDSADDVYPGAEEVCGDLIDQDCDGEDLVCEGVLQCCECKWSCFFVNEYGSGTATSTSTINTTGSFDDCQTECWEEATGPSSDCVSNIDIIYARPCD